eukprot:4880200-Lingulodinium_polyedra.AAC.1
MSSTLLTWFTTFSISPRTICCFISSLVARFSYLTQPTSEESVCAPHGLRLGLLLALFGISLALGKD